MSRLPLFARPSLSRIVQNLCATPPVSVALVGGPLMGKSLVLAAIAAEVEAAIGDGHRVVQINCAQISPDTHPPVASAENSAQVVLLDNVQEITRWGNDERRLWFEWLASSPPERGLLLASRRPIHEIGGDISSDIGIHLPYFQQSFLGLIDQAEATQLVRSALADHSDSESLLEPLVEWCGGHPFLLDRMAELLTDVVGMLPMGQSIGPAHLPLLRLRLAAVYGRLLFDSQGRAVACQDDADEKPIESLLRQLLRAGVHFDQLLPTQAEAMNWLLVQGLVGIEGLGYRLFSPLFQDYLTTKLRIDPAAVSAPQPRQDALYVLVERESHRFTPQEKNLLLYFLDRPGAIVSVDELLAEVWQRPDGSLRRVQEGIRRLRHRLAEFDGSVGTIDNEWGQGYRYVPLN